MADATAQAPPVLDGDMTSPQEGHHPQPPFGDNTPKADENTPPGQSPGGSPRELWDRALAQHQKVPPPVGTSRYHVFQDAGAANDEPEAPAHPSDIAATLDEALRENRDTPRGTVDAVAAWAVKEISSNEKQSAVQQWQEVQQQYAVIHQAGPSLTAALRAALSKPGWSAVRGVLQKAGIRDVLPADHFEPLQRYEKKNIVLGYGFGVFTCAVAIALDVTHVSENLSDWAQRRHCPGCPRICDLPEGSPDNGTIKCAKTIFGSEEFLGLQLPMLWIGVVAASVLLLTITYFSGRLHLDCGVRVNYTRKITHCSVYIINVLIRFVFAAGDSIETLSYILLSSALVIMIFHGVFLKPVRRRWAAARMMWASMDRPEDRPYSLRWLTTQNVAYFVVWIPVMYVLVSLDKYQLSLISIIASAFGDGLAEPVGIMWGRHKYKARALWYDGRFCAGAFTRSLEGSLCVFLFSCLGVGICYQWFDNGTQFGVCMGVVPFAVTLCEAFAPHTWDNPFLTFVANALVILIVATL